MAKIQTSQGTIKFRSKFLYVGIKQIDKEIAFENLKLVAQVLNRLGIKWGPFLGTLLGIVRENDFITWDEDTDLYILEEDEDILKSSLWELMSFGFEVIRYERRGLYSIMRKGEYIDFYVMHKITPELRHSGGSDYIFNKYLTETILWDFKGLSIAVPKDYDEFLTFQYGDWRTPVQYADFNLGLFKRTFLRFKSEIKNNLPNRIYYFLLHRYHQKSFAHFKEKCLKKGIALSDNIKLPKLG